MYQIPCRNWQFFLFPNPPQVQILRLKLIMKNMSNQQRFTVYSCLLCHFVTWKSSGGLVIPSKSVIEICTETEKCIMRMLNMTGGKLPNCKNLLGTISTAVLATCVGSSVFKALDNHMFDTTATNNHIAALIKCCAQSYTHIRLKHHTKRQTDIITRKKVRKQLTKLILFNHQ